MLILNYTSTLSVVILCYKGKMQCGPCPLEAVRTGEIGIGFDTPFVFSEVNADRIFYVRDPTSNSGFRKAQSDKTRYIIVMF